MQSVVMAVSVSVVLMLALYGAAKLLGVIQAKMLYPARSRAAVVLWLTDATEDAEYQIRASQYAAKTASLPLVIVDRADDPEVTRIAEILVTRGGGELTGELPIKR